MSSLLANRVSDNIVQLAARIESHAQLSSNACNFCRYHSFDCYTSDDSIRCSQCVRRRSHCSLSLSSSSSVSMSTVDLSIRSAEETLHLTSLSLVASFRQLEQLLSFQRSLSVKLAQTSALLGSLRARAAASDFSDNASEIPPEHSSGGDNSSVVSFSPILQPEFVDDNLNLALLSEDFSFDEFLREFAASNS